MESLTSETVPGWVTHLQAFRVRFLRFLCVYAIACVPFIYYAGPWYHMLAAPLESLSPEGPALIATNISTPFTVPLKLALISALVVCAPFGLYQLWAFIAQGLYPYERKRFAPLVVMSTFLFYTGASLAYFVVCPMALAFFHRIAPDGVLVITELSHYLHFILSLCLAFGACFQIPLIIWIALYLGLVSAQQLRTMRPYVIVGSFILGMLLTPPDVISQVMLAIPMCLLFEISLYLGDMAQKRRIHNC